MSEDDITVDDIVTQDEFESLETKIETIAEKVTGGESDEHEDDPDPTDELPEGIVTEDEMPDFEDFTDKDEAAEVADRTFMSRMSHLVNENCDTEACNEIREKFGIDPTDSEESEQGPDHDHDDDESADDADSSDEGTDSDDDDGGGTDRTPFEVV